MKIARVLLWLECNRNCNECCNKYKSLIDQMKPITFEELKDFDIICLTGGEPMLHPKKVISIINQLRTINKKAKIYLYTALYKQEIVNILPLIDGLQFSIHYPASVNDISNFMQLQKLLINRNRLYRAYIDNRVLSSITIIPRIWTRLEVKAWLKEEDCPLPKDEQLFLLKCEE